MYLHVLYFVTLNLTSIYVWKELIILLASCE